MHFGFFRINGYAPSKGEFNRPQKVQPNNQNHIFNKSYSSSLTFTGYNDELTPFEEYKILQAKKAEEKRKAEEREITSIARLLCSRDKDIAKLLLISTIYSYKGESMQDKPVNFYVGLADKLEKMDRRDLSKIIYTCVYDTCKENAGSNDYALPFILEKIACNYQDEGNKKMADKVFGSIKQEGYSLKLINPDIIKDIKKDLELV